MHTGDGSCVDARLAYRDTASISVEALVFLAEVIFDN